MKYLVFGLIDGLVIGLGVQAWHSQDGEGVAFFAALLMAALIYETVYVQLDRPVQRSSELIAQQVEQETERAVRVASFKAPARKGFEAQRPYQQGRAS